MSSQKPDFLPTFTKTWNTSPTPSIFPARPELSAKGKVVVITGGGTGIGPSIALSFAKAGASAIGLVARRAEKLQETQTTIQKAVPGVKIQYDLSDVTDFSALQNAFQELSSSFGKIDELVFSAGYLNNPATIMDSDPENWWKTEKITILGIFNTIRAFVPLASSDAELINITSAIAHIPSTTFFGMSAYASSRIVSAKIVEYAGNELKDKGIRVVNVQPGVVSTDMNTQYLGLDTGRFLFHS
jgi:NAD(P)-dependent dehydrogenase (short-subunit alcohol dehydrogenase family)